MSNEKLWDVFVSHASEDKEAFVRPLANALRSLGVRVWYDEFSLQLGDSLSKSIDKGIAASRFGFVIISPHFISKKWPDYELRGLIAREIEEDKVILPVWHKVTKQTVLQFSPSLADKIALESDRISAQDVALSILRVVRPDLYSKHPRAALEKLVDGTALKELQEELSRTRQQLEQAQEELSEYRCPYCDAILMSRVHGPTDPSEKDWDFFDDYACGYQAVGNFIQRPCPTDPRFPKFTDYEIKFYKEGVGRNIRWHCYAIGKTDMARRVNLPPGSGRSRKEAEQSIRQVFDKYARH